MEEIYKPFTLIGDAAPEMTVKTTHGVNKLPED